MGAIECESCAASGLHGIPAVGHSHNRDWSGYWLCAECIAEYDSREQLGTWDDDELDEEGDDETRR